jgi:hypothetical protein
MAVSMTSSTDSPGKQEAKHLDEKVVADENVHHQVVSQQLVVTCQHSR